MTAIDPIITAIYRADVAALADLLSHDAVSIFDEDGRTPLMHAVLAEQPNMTIIAMLLQAGSPFDHHDAARGWTALHFAAQDGRTDVVSMLVRAGAEVDAVDSFGNTPLIRAVLGATRDNQTVIELLQSGADPDRQNARGVSPRALAASIANYDVASAFDGR